MKNQLLSPGLAFLHNSVTFSVTVLGLWALRFFGLEISTGVGLFSAIAISVAIGLGLNHGYENGWLERLADWFVEAGVIIYVSIYVLGIIVIMGLDIARENIVKASKWSYRSLKWVLAVSSVCVLWVIAAVFYVLEIVSIRAGKKLSKLGGFIANSYLANE